MPSAISRQQRGKCFNLRHVRLPFMHGRHDATALCGLMSPQPLEVVARLHIQRQCGVLSGSPRRISAANQVDSPIMSRSRPGVEIVLRSSNQSHSLHFLAANSNPG